MELIEKRWTNHNILRATWTKGRFCRNPDPEAPQFAFTLPANPVDYIYIATRHHQTVDPFHKAVQTIVLKSIRAIKPYGPPFHCPLLYDNINPRAKTKGEIEENSPKVFPPKASHFTCLNETSILRFYNKNITASARRGEWEIGTGQVNSLLGCRQVQKGAVHSSRLTGPSWTAGTCIRVPRLRKTLL